MTLPSLKLLDLGIDGFAVVMEVAPPTTPGQAPIAPVALSSGDSRPEAIERAELFLQRAIVAVGLLR